MKPGPKPACTCGVCPKCKARARWNRWYATKSRDRSRTVNDAELDAKARVWLEGRKRINA